MKKRFWKGLSDCERLEKSKKILDELKGKLVIVEGKKDVAALSAVGVDAFPWYSLDFESVEGDVVILTDIDEEGHRLCKDIVEKLSGKAAHIDAQTRGRLASFLELRRFEEINKKMEKKEVELWQKHI